MNLFVKPFVCTFTLFSVLSCVPSLKDCDVAIATVENLISITPVQSQFQVGDILTIACTIPAQNTYFGGFDQNIFNLTGDTTALWSYGSGSLIIGDQQLIVRKGAIAAPNFLAIYNPACDCYEFEADLILSEIGTYGESISSTITIRKADCDGFRIEPSFPWTNFPNRLEFEVVP